LSLLNSVETTVGSLYRFLVVKVIASQVLKLFKGPSYLYPNWYTTFYWYISTLCTQLLSIHWSSFIPDSWLLVDIHYDQM